MINLNTEVVRIELAGTYFNIPMRYMYGQAIEKYHQWPKAKQERVVVGALSLSVLLPDLRPYYQEDDAHWKVRGHGNRVEVSIMKPVGGDNWYQGLRQRINGEVEEGVTIKANGIHGLVHFSTPLSEKYFPTNERIELVASCDRDPNLLSPSCKVKSSYRPGIVLEYYYGLEHLPDWRAIDDGLKAMFDRFEQDNQPKQTKEQ